MPSHRKTHRKPTAAVANAETAAKPADPFRPWLLAGMAAALVARPLFPSESAAAQGDGLAVVMLWLALLAIWLVAMVGRTRFTLRFGAVDAALLVLVAWQSIAALHAVRYGSPRPALNMLWESVGLGIVFFLARQLIVDARDMRAVVAVMIALMAAISVYGIYQYAIEQPARQKQFAADPERMLRDEELSLNYPPGTPLRDLFEKRLANREPVATFALTNSLAAALAPWLVIGLGLAASWRQRWRWIAWMICLVPIAVCLLLTKSRSGYVAAIAGIVWLAIRRWQSSRHPTVLITPTNAARRCPRDGIASRRSVMSTAVAATVLAGLLAVATLLAVFAKPAMKKAATSLGYRLEYWQATLHLIADRPWLGCGPGNFQDVYTQYKLPEASEEVSDPHNFLLEIWATAGTPAMLALLGALGLFWRRVGLPWFNPEPAATECAVGATAHSVAGGSGLNGGLKPPLLPIFAGAIGGFLLAIPLGQISSGPPNNMAFVIGLPVAVVCMALLIPWVRDPQAGAPTFSPNDHGYMVPAGLGVAVLLVDLLTTGGMEFPAIAQSLWLLLALGLSGDRPRELPRAAAIVLLTLGLGLMVACYQTSYARVLPCQSSQLLARHEFFAGHRQSTIEHLQRAVAADPRSSDAQASLAEMYLEAWLANLDAADYEAFETHDALARQMAPEAAPIWRGSAERYRQAYAKTDAQGRRLQPHAIEQAIASAQRTVELYPGNGNDRAALALIYQLSGDEGSYQREAQKALELDRRMPHEDKKLPEELRRKLEAAVGGQ